MTSNIEILIFVLFKKKTPLQLHFTSENVFKYRIKSTETEMWKCQMWKSLVREA